eukprot:1152292-Pelagomonas_calceolata.AAC.1
MLCTDASRRAAWSDVGNWHPDTLLTAQEHMSSLLGYELRTWMLTPSVASSCLSISMRAT